MKRYFIHWPGMVYAGTVYGRNAREAREAARNIHGLRRLPRGVAVWEAA